MRTHLLAVVAVLCGAGCVTVYHPMQKFQRPVVVDPGVENFSGLRLLIHCKPSDYVKPSDANLLCRKLSRLFENQGAEVETVTTPELASGAVGEERKEADLTVELSAREVHSEKNVMLWAVSLITLTIVPAFNEFGFAQDISIRDRTGFLLAKETMSARFVRYIGAGALVFNWLLDAVWREDDEDLTGDVFERGFSKDFYGQLSQLVFNARMRSDVLHGPPPKIAPSSPTEAPNAPPPAREPSPPKDNQAPPVMADEPTEQAL